MPAAAPRQQAATLARRTPLQMTVDSTHKTAAGCASIRRPAKTCAQFPTKARDQDTGVTRTRTRMRSPGSRSMRVA